MKNKFIRIISPITLVVTILFDAAVCGFAFFAVSKIKEEVSFYSVAFLCVEVFLIFLAVSVTREVTKHGIEFRSDEFEFTAIDSENIFKYSDIKSIEIQRDDKVSLTKNFNDRHSFIILNHFDDTNSEIDIGLTSRKKLLSVQKEIADKTNAKVIIKSSNEKNNPKKRN